MLSDQKWVYPSLGEAMIKRGGPHKLDVVKTEYWEKGIDTDGVPREILTEYLIGDVTSTVWLFEEQAKVFADKPKMFRLFRLTCDDLKVLEEMEANGLKLDVQLCHKRATETREKIEGLESKLAEFSNGLPINWDSNDHLSAVLFGGGIVIESKVSDGFYKTGQKAGQPKLKNVSNTVRISRLFDPDDDWEVKKTKDLSDTELEINGKCRLYFTNDDVLSKLPSKSPIIKLLKDRAKWVKILEYYTKLPQQIVDMQWEDDKLHGQFNQVVTKTGRSSSSKPNLQNFALEIQDILISRF